MKEKKFLSIAQVAKILGISRIAVYQKVKKGQIEAIRIGRNYAIPEDFVKKKVVNIKGYVLTEEEKSQIERAVEKTVEEYGEVLRMLGKE